MEGSMKTMSRSRYHALSWSFSRMRGHLRSGGAKRTGRAGHAVAASVISGAAADRTGNGAPPQAQGFGGEFRARMFRSITAIFRTRVLPGDTDI
jgi:hypothetical protein